MCVCVCVSERTNAANKLTLGAFSAVSLLFLSNTRSVFQVPPRQKPTVRRNRTSHPPAGSELCPESRWLGQSIQISAQAPPVSETDWQAQIQVSVYYDSTGSSLGIYINQAANTPEDLSSASLKRLRWFGPAGKFCIR